MSDEKQNISIKISDRNFNVKCKKNQINDLVVAAKYLDNKLRELRIEDRIVSTDTLLTITALNITNELLVQKNQIQIIQDIVDSAIEKH